MTARWTTRVIPLEPGNESGPALIVVDVVAALEIDVRCRDQHLVWSSRIPLLTPLVACQLGQALQDASAWCGAERARRKARKR